MDKTMIDAPCKGCEKLGCGPYHDQCEKYRAYRESVAAYKRSQLVVMANRSYVKKAVQRMKGRK